MTKKLTKQEEAAYRSLARALKRLREAERQAGRLRKKHPAAKAAQQGATARGVSHEA